MHWVEKYRPKSLNEITSQNNIIDSLKKTLFTKNLPHLIFYSACTYTFCMHLDLKITYTYLTSVTVPLSSATGRLHRGCRLVRVFRDRTTHSTGGSGRTGRRCRRNVNIKGSLQT